MDYYVCYFNNIGGYHTKLVYCLKNSSYSEAEKWFDRENQMSGLKLELAFITTDRTKAEGFR